MTGLEAAADTVKRRLGFHVTSVSSSGERALLESLELNDKDELVPRSCRPIHAQEIAMWNLLVELQAKVDDLESDK